MKLFIYSLFLLPFSLFAETGDIEGTVRHAETKEGIAAVEVYVQEIGKLLTSDRFGNFKLSKLNYGQYTFQIFAPNYNSFTQQIQLDSPSEQIEILLTPLSTDLTTVNVSAKNEWSTFRHLRSVEGTAIYAAKKSEVIELDGLVANLATNNAREVYRAVAGLNVWENDGAGLQLAIGARGLDPNRTSNFNTRQNGFDISADALGYPESYYTPPTQALQRIEIVRGAASLQYGTQFGGLLNFKLKEGTPDKPLEFISENTIGSFGLFNSFNSLGGTKGKLNYYAFYQRKQGDGWRENSGFHQNTAYLDVHYDFTPKLKVGLELTHMNYLAQQAGGLTDAQFRFEDPRQSNRARNWFDVDWKLAALHIDYKISEHTQLNFRNFLLDARRQALGELGPINRPEPMRERDLIAGNYQNMGSEGRLMHRYKIAGNITHFLVGYRYYRGYSTNEQGDASAGS
ncbi:MAG: carboxypeptidase-like regulatory domain-containing protein, partial [Bacteroidota bacterium]